MRFLVREDLELAYEILVLCVQKAFSGFDQKSDENYICIDKLN